MTNTTENITLPQTLFAGGNKKEASGKSNLKRHQFIHDLFRALEFHSVATDNKTVLGHFRNIVYIFVTSFACQHQ